MTPTRSHAASTLSLAIVAAVSAGTAATPALAGDLPTYTNEQFRLVAFSAVGLSDQSERDYAIADFDNDGAPDLVAGRRFGLNNNNGTPAANVLFMNQSGALTDRTADLAPDLGQEARTRDVIAVDVNADGWMDVVVADGPFAQLRVLLNQGEGAGGAWAGLAFAPEATTGIFIDGWTLAAGDLVNDGDAYPDLFVGVRTLGDRLIVNRGVDGKGNWLGFANESSRLGGNATTSAVRSSSIGDFDQDGDMDILQGVTLPTGASRILWNVDGQFSGTPTTVSTQSTYNVASNDMDGDGDLDMISVRNGGDIVRFNETVNPAPNTIDLGPNVSLAGSNGFGSITRQVDLDGDGVLDILVCDLDQEFPQDCSRRLRVWLGSNPAGAFTQAWAGGAAWLPNGTSDVAPIDIDGDGDLDLVVGHCSGTTVWMKDGSPDPAPAPGDVDGDGDVDFQDLTTLLAVWGPCPGGGACPADFDSSGDVGLSDLLVVLANWTV